MLEMMPSTSIIAILWSDALLSTVTSSSKRPLWLPVLAFIDQLRVLRATLVNSTNPRRQASTNDSTIQPRPRPAGRESGGGVITGGGGGWMGGRSFSMIGQA